MEHELRDAKMGLGGWPKPRRREAGGEIEGLSDRFLPFRVLYCRSDKTTRRPEARGRGRRSEVGAGKVTTIRPAKSCPELNVDSQSAVH